MIHLNPVEPSHLNPFTLANDMNVFSWHALLLKMQKSRKTLVVTGAGISVEAGIPDFRSEKGLYNLVKKRYPCVVLKGKDLFDASLFRNPESTKLFYTFMGELSTLSAKARLTKTHGFISYLEKRGSLLRWYTQNIDGLEERALDKDQENVKIKKETTLVKKESTIVKNETTIVKKEIIQVKKNSKIIQLHGTLQSVKCTLCSNKQPLIQEHVEIYFKKGIPPPCPSCDSKAQVRSALGKRAISVGSLRPDVVLYNEHHDEGEEIASLIQSDLLKKPTALLVLGTSLKVSGIRAVVKAAAKAVIASHGVVVLINDVSLGKEWDGVFTHWIEGKCDVTCELLQKGLVSFEKKKQASSPLKSPVEVKSKTDSKITSVFKNTKKEKSERVKTTVAV